LLKGEIKSIALLGGGEIVKWRRSPEGLMIERPGTLPSKYAAGFQVTLK
jgi:hypothetical protein